MSKLYVLSYHEIQIAGFRIFVNYEEALTEYLKHCILETKNLLESPSPSECSDSKEKIFSSDEDESEEEKLKEEEESAASFDDMTCCLEIQELQEGEYISLKEYDYETFQMFLEDKTEIPEFLESLEKSLDENKIPDELKDVFSQ